MTSREHATVFGAPRVSPGVIERPQLLAQLDGPAPLVVLRGHGGTGKTTLLAQWTSAMAKRQGPAVVWVSPDGITRTRSGYWMRVLGHLHAAGIIDDGTLYREMTSLADSPDSIRHVLQRAVQTHPAGVVLVLDNVGAAQTDTYWNSVCHDIVAAVRETPMLRCVVAGRFPTPLESPSIRSAVEVHLIDDKALKLSQEEISAIVDMHGAFLDAEGREAVIDLPLATQAMSLRYTLDLLRRSPDDAKKFAAGGASLPLLEVARQDLLSRIHDDGLLEFLGATALSPVVTVELAADLTGEESSAELFDGLERAGVGHWIRMDDGVPAFRYNDYVRAAATHEYEARHPNKVKSRHASIARWLFEEREEARTAVDHAIKARDLEYTSHVLMRAFPLSQEDRIGISALLDEIPGRQIHRHPLLALWYALQLNAREGSQARAAEYFVSSAVIGRLRSSSIDPAEQAIRQGLESTVWRLLGKSKRMIKSATNALEAMEQTLRADDRDESLQWASLTVLHQCGISLLYGSEHARAVEAFRLLLEVAERQKQPQFMNCAHAGLAMTGVIRGDFRDAKKSLESIDHTIWPDTWKDGYMAAFAYIAQAWVHANDGQPAQALKSLNVLDPHADTIEHWEFMLGARVLAESMLGRVHEAKFLFDKTRAARTSGRTLESVTGRLAVADGLLGLASGSPRNVARDVPSDYAISVAHSLDALNAARHGAEADAHAKLAEAEAVATSPMDEAFMAIAGIVSSHHLSVTLPVERYAAHLEVLNSEHGLRWPLILLPQSDRDHLLAKDVTGAPERVLRKTFTLIPALLDLGDEPMMLVPQLTKRERELLRAMITIESRADLAEHLFVSVNTVKSQLRSLYAKLGAANREEALHKALTLGLIERSQAPKE